jgi:hypothetical protein
MSATEQTNEQAIDAAIATQSAVVSKINSDIDTQERYQNSDSAYLRHRYDADLHAKLLADLDTAHVALKLLTDQYTGWTRYYHVTNTGGHIHTSLHCSSCFPDTQFAWRTDLSGLTVEQVVEQEAYNACTVCMPIAPAEQKAAREYFNRQQREAKAAEKAAIKAAKELAKLPRQQAQAIKVNEIYDAFGEDTSAAYKSIWPGGQFEKGYETAYYVYSDMIEGRNRRAR